MLAPAPFSGVYAMLYAFYGADGKLDREAMRTQTRACLANGAHGIACLGLATEVDKLSQAERHQLLEWAAEDIAGVVPLAVTIADPTIGDQIAFAHAAKAAGADWVILQPPPARGLVESEYVRFFGAVADQVDLPVAIQNAGEFLGVALTAPGFLTLQRNHPNVTLIKQEGSALATADMIARTEGKFAVFAGRGGLELPDNLRAGCVGMIPAPDCVDVQVRIFEHMCSQRPEAEAEAEAEYRTILPVIAFAMQGLPQLLCYGKRITAARLGLGEVYDRPPGLLPSDFGIACAARYAKALGPYRRARTAKPALAFP
ncbi:MAG: dihydrodipicolinate synthase family protein [Alphaproteobacteria bacterium]